MRTFPFSDGDRILFQGDSITAAGRGEDTRGIGSGYVAIIKGRLAATAPDRHVEVLNRGIGGDRSAELVERWRRDCIDLRPTHLSIMVGVNDIWVKFDPHPTKKHIGLADYRANYRRLLDEAAGAGIENLILMAPTTVRSDPAHEANVLCAEYAAAVKEFAAEYGAVYVPTRERIWEVVRRYPPIEQWLPDAVHPSVAGHGIIAGAWLAAVGAPAAL